MAVVVLALGGGAAAGLALASRNGAPTQHAAPPPTNSGTAPLQDTALPTSTTSTTSTTQADSTTLPSSGAMDTIAGLLARSADVRPTVQGAIDQVETCAIPPAQGEQVLQVAVTTRQALLTQAQALDLSGLAQGGAMGSALDAAIQDSATADQDYEQWMEDFAAQGMACGSPETADPAFNSGQAASQQATADKNTFDGLWNAVAGQYGQRTYGATDW